ncbi:unnamed protein product [Pleuronectes platessa]|uniref:Uncharacterized protein n=1 Tax=Pleuronectes platessa TaxID=8262 RepID=A0A9N7Z7X7_PLEPL|nr:unnamed protein product [Pleuronectes platessa]
MRINLPPPSEGKYSGAARWGQSGMGGHPGIKLETGSLHLAGALLLGSRHRTKAPTAQVALTPPPLGIDCEDVWRASPGGVWGGGSVSLTALMTGSSEKTTGCYNRH